VNFLLPIARSHFVEQQDDEANYWQAHAEFKADEYGVVDLDSQQPIDTYTGVTDGVVLVRGDDPPPA
jgi:hypothetical protein